MATLGSSNMFTAVADNAGGGGGLLQKKKKIVKNSKRTYLGIRRPQLNNFHVSFSGFVYGKEKQR